MKLKPKYFVFKVFYSPPNPYENIFVSADITEAEQARHKLLVEQLKSQRARGETDIIRGDSIVTRAKSQR